MFPHSAAMHFQQLLRQCVSLSHPWGWLDIIQVLCVCNHSPCVFMWAKSLSCRQMLSPYRQTSTTSGSCKLSTSSSTMEPLAGSVTKISHLNWAFCGLLSSKYWLQVNFHLLQGVWGRKEEEEEEEEAEKCTPYEYEGRNLGYSLFLCPKHIMCMCGIIKQ